MIFSCLSGFEAEVWVWFADLVLGFSYTFLIGFILVIEGIFTELYTLALTGFIVYKGVVSFFMNELKLFIFS